MIHVTFDRESKVALFRQIYRSIRQDILAGKIKGNTRLPSTRQLSEELHVARNVILECYDQLAAEGYVYTRSGAGTYVNTGLVLSKHTAESDGFSQSKESVGSEGGKRTLTRVSFRTGIPDLSCIPVRKWGQMYHKVALDIQPEQMDYQNPQGDLHLRKALADYLNRARGTLAEPDNILITNGAAQAFHLLCQLVGTHEYVAVEDPLSLGLKNTLEKNAVSMQSVPLDENGLNPEALPQKSQAPALIFTTPSHQFPTGSVLTASRRVALMNYVSQKDSYIVEDDYDSEFRFDGYSTESIQSMAPDRVIYVGTFSKTLMPSLRIGYMVLPAKLRKKMCESKYLSDIHSTELEQRTLAEFLESGAFELHLERMRKHYHHKRNLLISCLQNTFGERVHITGAAAGLHLVAAFSDVSLQESLMEKIHRAGIEITSVESHLLDRMESTKYENELVFGYGNMEINTMKQGVELLAQVLYSGQN